MKQIKIGALLGVVGIVLGAFGAHGLTKVASETIVDSYKTGVNYQMIHAFYFIIIGILFKLNIINPKQLKRISILALIGVICFSGSIYGITLSKVMEFPTIIKFFGPITPIGGLLLIFSWLLLFISQFNKK